MESSKMHVCMNRKAYKLHNRMESIAHNYVTICYFTISSSWPALLQAASNFLLQAGLFVRVLFEYYWVLERIWGVLDENTFWLTQELCFILCTMNCVLLITFNVYHRILCFIEEGSVWNYFFIAISNILRWLLDLRQSRKGPVNSALSVRP